MTAVDLVDATWGGPSALSKTCFQGSCHGQAAGGCSRSRRADDAIRAGTLVSRRRGVPVVARACVPPAIAPRARVRLNAIAARISQALFAAKDPQGRCARADALRSAKTCSMIACPRWTLSVATVSSTSAGVVVKNAGGVRIRLDQDRRPSPQGREESNNFRHESQWSSVCEFRVRPLVK